MLGRLVGGILLVAGTTIGAGMLALPVVTAIGGFLPALCMCFLCWAFMTSTGFLFLEACLHLPPGANLATMAETYLGKTGKVCAWILYLFLFYCLSVAYLSVGGALLRSWIGENWISSSCAVGLFLTLFAPCVYAGAKIVDRINSWMMLGLGGSYFAFVWLCIPLVQTSFLERMQWSGSFLALPVIFTSFSFHGIIPSLISYLKREAKLVRLAILLGTGLAFLIYILWEVLILGAVPFEGPQGLFAAHRLGLSAVVPLQAYLGAHKIVPISQAFAFFAVATSFLGVTLGLFDFLADGLGWAKKGWSRLKIAALTFLPPFAITLVYPSLFLKALSMAGGIGCALLLGLFPVLVCYQARYRKPRLDRWTEQVGGGKFFLWILVLFVLFELMTEFY